MATTRRTAVKKAAASTPRTAAVVQREFDAFKETVREVAARYADEHDMCNVVDDALEELGLPPIASPKRKVIFEVEVDPEGENGWVDDDYLDAAREQIRYGGYGHKITTEKVVDL